MPRQREDRDARASARRPSTGRSRARSTSANRSRATSTGSSWSPTASASTPSSSASSSPTRRPARSRPTSKTCPRSRSKTSTSTSSPRTAGLMATPTHCTHLHRRGSTSSPGTTALPDQPSSPALQPQLRARTAAPARRRSVPSSRALSPAPSNPRGRRLLQLPPEARPRRRRPVPRRPQLHDAARASPATCAGITYCPEAAIAAAAAEARPRRAGQPELPGLARRSAPPTSPPAPAATRSTRSAGCTWPGRSRARRSASRRSPRRWPAPMTTASSSSGSPSTSTRSTAQVTRGLRHGPADHRRRPDPDALDPGQHRQAELHDQPDQLLALLGRLAGDRRPGHGRRLLLLLPRGQLRDPPLQAEDDGPPARRPQGRPSGAANPRTALRAPDPQRRRQHQVGSR